MATKNSQLRFSITLAPYDRWPSTADLFTMAQAAETMGYFGVHLPEHIISPIEPAPKLTHHLWYDNFVLASFLASQTRNLRMIFYILVVPYRQPIPTAKALATLDLLSQGRVICGMGSGWLESEFQQLAVPFEQRGEIMDEYIQAMRALWTEDKPAIKGRHVSFSGLLFTPKCYQRPHIRLWIGGQGVKPLRRVVRFGNGWAPMSGSLAKAAENIRWIKEQCVEAGRDPDGLDFATNIGFGEPDPVLEKQRQHVTGSSSSERPRAFTPQAAIELIKEHQRAGFTHLGVTWNWGKPNDYVRRMELFAKEVMPAFAK